MSKARDIADLDFNSPDIDGGNIDGATLGANTVTGTMTFNSAPTFNTAISMNSSLNVASTIGIAGTTVISGSKDLENIRNITTTGNVGIGQFPTSFSGWQVLDIKGGSDGAMVNFEDAASTRLGAVAMDTGNALRIQTFTSGTSSIKFEPNNAVALTLDSNQDATFEGSITCNDGTGSLVISNDSSSNTYLSASGQFRVRPEGTSVNKIIFDAEYIHGPAFTTNNSMAGIGVSPGDVNGVEVGPGYITLARDDTADADQVKFFKNGSLHSRLKTGNNYLEIYNEGSDIHLTTSEASSAKRINFSGSIPSFKSFDSNSGEIDLGTSGAKWKDLYLSGGAYLGGHSSAHHLDYYEEGTWTPVLRGSSTTGSMTQPNSSYQTAPSGVYRRVGGLIYLKAFFSGVALSGATGSLQMTGMPFNSASYHGVMTYCEGFDPAYNKSRGGSNPSGQVIVRGSGSSVSFGPAYTSAWDVYLDASTTSFSGGGNGVHGTMVIWGHI